MEDQTPLNLEDSPKLFGLRYDQLIACLGSLIVSTQLYSWLSPVPFMGHDLRLDVAIFLGLLGPAYCLFTLNHTTGHWEGIMNFYMSSQVYIPGPDPNPVRFLKDEKLPEFIDQDLDDSLEIEVNAFIEKSALIEEPA
ncbi:hypothetical protein KF728_15915 [Candidatus Obscuribacterales bacterium]|nr:hypothetical protein [Candidatus Obscuribacterales bacterium]MBX3151641.1 hypothetical protein [Candidatus Obscuribacterales bacterium]